MNKLMKMLLAAAALLPALCAAQVASQYRVTEVGGTLLNDLGQSAGLSEAGKLQVWDRNGVLSERLGSVRNGVLNGMNSDGVVVGSAVMAEFNDFSQPMIWRNGGAPQRLDVRGTSGVALGINNQGDIIGRIAGTRSNGESGTIGFLQHNGTTTYFDDFLPSAINEEGQVMGSRSGSWSYWILDNGAFTEFTHTGLAGSSNIRAFNSNGYAAGNFQGKGAMFTGSDVLQFWDGEAFDMNDSNMVVGYSDHLDAMLYAGGKSYVLDHLMTDPNWSGWSLDRAQSINGQGDILVRAFQDTGSTWMYTMLLLSPVPEPAMGLMLLAGLALVYSRPAMRRTISSP